MMPVVLMGLLLGLAFVLGCWAADRAAERR